jgi:hypothetical protein
MATLQNAVRATATSDILIGVICLQTASPRRALMSIGFATIPLGAKLLDIGQSLTQRYA